MLNNANHGSLPSGSYVAHAIGVVSHKITLNVGLETGDSESNDNHDAAVDFGFYLGASLGNQVWVDANNNGTYDVGEEVLAGITITLLDANAIPIAGAPTMTTNAQGQYHYGGLVAGSYRIKFSAIPAQYRFTSIDSVAANDNTSDADTTTGITSVLSVSVGQHRPLLDAGLVRISSPSVLSDTGVRVLQTLVLTSGLIAIAAFIATPRFSHRIYKYQATHHGLLSRLTASLFDK